MTDQDLQMIRAILKEELKPISERLDSVERRLDSVEQRLDSMDRRLTAVERRLDSVERRLDRLEEGQVEIRTCVNALVEWADKVSEAANFPLPRL